MKLTLYRTPSTEFGTFGLLFHGPYPLCVTLEDPWKNNSTGVSCIPNGTYKCSPHYGRFKDVWVLNNVSGRSAILIHAGNTHKDTSGCILVGESIGDIKGVPAVLNSVAALNKLKTHLPKSFEIEILNFSPSVFNNPKPKNILQKLFKE